MSLDSFLICFWQFYFLSQTDDFAKAIAFACLCMAKAIEAIFSNIQNALIFGILGVFERGFLHRKTILCQ